MQKTYKISFILFLIGIGASQLTWAQILNSDTAQLRINKVKTRQTEVIMHILKSKKPCLYEVDSFDTKGRVALKITKTGCIGQRNNTYIQANSFAQIEDTLLINSTLKENNKTIIQWEEKRSKNNNVLYFKENYPSDDYTNIMQFNYNKLPQPDSALVLINENDSFYSQKYYYTYTLEKFIKRIIIYSDSGIKLMENITNYKEDGKIWQEAQEISHPEFSLSTRTFEYDQKGHIISITDNQGNAMEYFYREFDKLPVRGYEIFKDGSIIKEFVYNYTYYD